MRQPFEWGLTVLDGQRGHLLPWMPVFFGAGVGGYFALRTEPTMLHLSVLGAVAFGLTLASFRWVRGGPVLLALALVAMGCVVAAYRTHSVAAPVLDFRYYGPIEGRIVGMDRSSSDKLRLTLSDVVLRRMAPADTPGRVRPTRRCGGT